VRGKNAVNPDGFTSILTKSQHKILVSKSDSSLNALAKEIMKWQQKRKEVPHAKEALLKRGKLLPVKNR
jgi:hypothetical protein